MSIKKCKPTHKRTIGFQSCEDRKEHFKFGLCKDCYILWLQSEKGKQFMNDMKIKAHIKTEKDLKKEYREDQKQKKESLKSLSQLKEEVQLLFNRLIRLIDSGYTCISCGDKATEAGHYYTKGGHDNIRFNAHNIHSQCHVCNCHKSGNETEYVNGLIERYGIEYFNMVRQLKSLESVKLLRSDIPELKKKVRQLIKRVENGEVITRDYINEYLNSY